MKVGLKHGASGKIPESALARGDNGCMSARRPDRPTPSARKGAAGRASSARTGSTSASATGTNSTRPRVGNGGPRPTSKSRPTSRNASRPSSTSRTTARPEVRGRVGVSSGSASIWPRVLTVRSFVLFIVLLLAFVMLLPTVRGYMGQRDQLQGMRTDVIEAQERQDELEFQLRRWRDDNFVASQARERLAYVYPGETAFRVLDPESVEPSVNPDTGKAVEDGIVEVGVRDAPWYTTIWNSVEVAGQVEPVGDEADEEAAEK